MASIFQRPGSPFWWLSWRNPASAKVERFSTRHRHGIAAETQRARKLCAERTALEMACAADCADARWDAWVPTFLKHSYQGRTQAAYLQKWSNVARYLASLDITTPQQVRRQHALGYLPWRLELGHLNSRKRTVTRNTALNELKVLSVVMHEAVCREFIVASPVIRLKLKKDPPRVKAELTDGDVALIRAEIARLRGHPMRRAREKADFFHVSFEIALAQGLRLNETHFQIKDIDWTNWCVRLRLKGNKVEEQSLNPSLRPLLSALRDEGREWTYALPWNPPLQWWKFFDRLRAAHPHLVNTSFHSTRVTVVSRIERSGVPEPVSMRIVNHASTTVHRVYRRLQPKELAPAWKALAQLTRPAPSARKQAAGGTQGSSPSKPGTT